MTRHRQGYFDSSLYLSQIFRYVTNVPFCPLFPDPVAPLCAWIEPVHQPEQDLVVGLDLDPHDATVAAFRPYDSWRREWTAQRFSI